MQSKFNNAKFGNSQEYFNNNKFSQSNIYKSQVASSNDGRPFTAVNVSTFNLKEQRNKIFLKSNDNLRIQNGHIILDNQSQSDLAKEMYASPSSSFYNQNIISSNQNLNFKILEN